MNHNNNNTNDNTTTTSIFLGCDSIEINLVVTTMSISDGNKPNLSPARAVVSLEIGVSVCSCSRYLQGTFLTYKTLSRHITTV